MWRALKADKAREIGLVEEVVGAGESLAAAMKLANQVGEQSRCCDCM